MIEGRKSVSHIICWFSVPQYWNQAVDDPPGSPGAPTGMPITWGNYWRSLSRSSFSEHVSLDLKLYVCTVVWGWGVLQQQSGETQHTGLAPPVCPSSGSLSCHWRAAIPIPLSSSFTVATSKTGEVTRQVICLWPSVFVWGRNGSIFEKKNPHVVLNKRKSNFYMTTYNKWSFNNLVFRNMKKACHASGKVPTIVGKCEAWVGVKRDCSQARLEALQ